MVKFYDNQKRQHGFVFVICVLIIKLSEQYGEISANSEIDSAFNMLINMSSPVATSSVSTSPLPVNLSSHQVQSRSQVQLQLCRPLVTTTINQLKHVILLRISTPASQVINPATTRHFSVDSTVYKLIIDVYGINPLPPNIINPSGILVSTRHKRYTATEEESRRVDPKISSRRNNKDLPRTRAIAVPYGNKMINSFRNETHGLLGSPDPLKIDRLSFVSRKNHQAMRHRLSEQKVRMVKPMDDLILYDRRPSEKNRRVREVMYTMEPLVSHWAIDMPETGIWSLYLTGQEASNITIKALTELDFEYEFLDYYMQTLELPPIANDPCIARLHTTSMRCLFNLSKIDLYDDDGQLLSSADIGTPMMDLSFEQPMSQGPGVSIQSVFTVPNVPFFISLRGYDIEGTQFQRLNSRRVVPRMFAISIHENFTSGQMFAPSMNATIKLWLRNADSDAIFKIAAHFDNELITAKVRPAIVKVTQKSFMSIVITVLVSPSLKYRTPVIMNLTATRTSDGLTEQLIESITAVPDTYIIDHWPPVCSVTSTSGGCRIGQACHLQRWGVKADVVDAMTGVASAEFVNTQSGAYTNVEISYVGTNETAIAEYRFTCCSTFAVLEVKDVVGNTGRCTLTASKLDRLTTEAAMVTDVRVDWTSVLISHTDRTLDDVESVNDWSVPSTVEPITSSGGHTAKGAQPNIVKRKTESWDDEKYQPLKTNAIIIGSVGASAGLSIVIITIACKIVRRKSDGRSDSGASDITMRENRWDCSESDTARVKKNPLDSSADIEMGTRDSVLFTPRKVKKQGSLKSATRVEFKEDDDTEVISAGMSTLSDHKTEDEEVSFRSIAGKEEKSQDIKEIHNERGDNFKDAAGETYRAMVDVQQRLASMNVRMQKLTDGSGYEDTSNVPIRVHSMRRSYCPNNDTPPGSISPQHTVRGGEGFLDSNGADEVGVDLKTYSYRHKDWEQRIKHNNCKIKAIPQQETDNKPQTHKQNVVDANSSRQDKDQGFVDLGTNPSRISFKINHDTSKTKHIYSNLSKGPYLKEESVYVHDPSRIFPHQVVRESDRVRRYLTPDFRRHVSENHPSADVRRCSAPEVTTGATIVHSSKVVLSGPIDSGTRKVSRLNFTESRSNDAINFSTPPDVPESVEKRNLMHAKVKVIGEKEEVEGRIKLQEDLRNVCSKLYTFQKKIDERLEETGCYTSDRSSSNSCSSLSSCPREEG